MWRGNIYDEDWERRKTYLIRSLFQDIPVLSPVPEDQESRSGAGSPSDVPPARPYSPLPPLLIERMPNKHDDPPEFYRTLEIKMKKLYRKLFLDEKSSSVEDLIERCAAGDITVCCNELYEDFSTGNHEESRSQNQIAFYQLAEDRMNRSGRVHCTRSSMTGSSNFFPLSRDEQSSTTSLHQSQITTVVEIHNLPSDHDSTVSLQEEINKSPVLEYQGMTYKKTLAQKEICEEEGVDKEMEKCCSNDITGTETSGSINLKDNGTANSVEIKSSGTSLKSIEMMRRQKQMSTSLGSLQGAVVASSGSRRSSTGTNAALQQKMSVDFPEDNHSSCNQLDSRDTSLSRSSLTFHDMLITSTPKLKELSKSKSSTESSSNGNRLRRNYSESSDTNSIVITKRRKYENIALQTSLTTTESDADDVIDWNMLKNNFFVGEPKIYKLCLCSDHSC